jgi:hypothetical protein
VPQFDAGAPNPYARCQFALLFSIRQKFADTLQFTDSQKQFGVVRPETGKVGDNSSRHRTMRNFRTFCYAA